MADWPMLAGAPASLRRDLTLREASQPGACSGAESSLRSASWPKPVTLLSTQARRNLTFRKRSELPEDKMELVPSPSCVPPRTKGPLRWRHP